MTKVYLTMCYTEYEDSDIVRIFTNSEEANKLAIAMKEESDCDYMHFYVKEEEIYNTCEEIDE